jgi:hypothetical protein
MALKYQIESIEDLPEPVREHYREEGGKWFLDAEGLKPQADLDRVTNALTAERKEKKEYKDKAAVWETRFTGKTPDEIFAQLDRIPLLEAESQGKVDAKRLQEITETTVKQRMAPLEHENVRLKQELTEHLQQIAEFKANDRRRTLHDAVRSIAVKEGFHETAYANGEGTLMLLAERNFTIDDAGDVIVAEGSKLLTPGLRLREALVEVKNIYPYLVKGSMGGGAAGSNGANGSTNNPFKQNNKTVRGQFMKENPDKWQKLMKDAGLESPYDDYKAR